MTASAADTVVWIVGEPGLGKTTLARALIGKIQRLVEKPKWTIGARAVAAGHYTGATFDGADTLPYTGGAAALAHWRDELGGPRLTILDGDRLSNAAAVQFFTDLGRPVRLACIHLWANEGVGADRRARRGSKQNETWLKGRVTKAAKFAAGFTDRLDLRGELGEEEMLRKARRFLGAL